MFVYHMEDLYHLSEVKGASLVAQWKRIHLQCRDAENTGLIPGLGRFTGGRNGNSSSILAWRIPWTEEPRGVAKNQT